MNSNPFLIPFTDNEAIESVIAYFKEHKNYAPTQDDLFDIDGRYSVESNQFMEVLIKMQTLEIIISLQDSRKSFRLTKLGYEIVQIGGWKKYLDQEQKKRWLVRFQYWWFWFAAVVPIVISIYTTERKSRDIATIRDSLSVVEQKLERLEKEMLIHPIDTVYNKPHKSHFPTKIQKDVK